MTLPAPTLSCHRIDDLLGRIAVGHNAAHVLRGSLVAQTVVLRGVDAATYTALALSLRSCGAEATADVAAPDARAVLFGPRATRRDRAAATTRRIPEITLESLAAICSVRAGLGDAAVAPPLALGTSGLTLVAG